jgi:hypothetical protein
MKRWLSFAVLIAAFALGSRLGWWMVPVVAALWGFMRPRVNAPAATAACAAAVAWGLWLLLDWQGGESGGLGRLSERLGGLFHVAPAVLLVVTLLLGFLLAWSAAAVAGGMAHAFKSDPGGMS